MSQKAIKNIILITLITIPSLSAPGRFKFSPANFNDKRMVIKLNEIANAGKRFDGNIYVYNDLNKFPSSGLRIYFNNTFNEETGITQIKGENNEDIFTITVTADYYQEFRYDGLGGREDKKKDPQITFGLRYSTTNSDKIMDALLYTEFENKRYYFPSESNMVKISWQASMTFLIISCVISFCIIFPQGGSNKNGQKSDSVWLLQFLKAPVFGIVCISLAVMIIRTFFQYIYLAYLWPSFAWFLVLGITATCSKRSEGQKVIGLILGGLGLLCVVASFFVMELAYLGIFAVYQIAFAFDFAMIDKSGDKKWVNFIYYIFITYCCFFSGVFYTFFHEKTLKGYPVDTSLSFVFWAILGIGALVNLLLLVFRINGEKIENFCSLLSKMCKKDESTNNQNVGNSIEMVRNDNDNIYNLRGRSDFPDRNPNEQLPPIQDIRIDNGNQMNRSFTLELKDNELGAKKQDTFKEKNDVVLDHNDIKIE